MLIYGLRLQTILFLHLGMDSALDNGSKYT